jgi:GcrA cell cycle regulator
MSFLWSDERVELLKALWNNGLSATQIAAQLGGRVSRSAVCGKAHRIGLSQTAERVALAKSLREPKAPPVKRAPNQNAGLAFGTRRRPKLPQPKGQGFVLPDFKPGSGLEKRMAAAVANAEAQITFIEPEKAFQPLAGVAPVPFVERSGECCRWPVGGSGADMLCCGAKAPAPDPYCRAHMRLSKPRPGVRESLDKRLGIASGKVAA